VKPDCGYGYLKIEQLTAGSAYCGTAIVVVVVAGTVVDGAVVVDGAMVVDGVVVVGSEVVVVVKVMIVGVRVGDAVVAEWMSEAIPIIASELITTREIGRNALNSDWCIGSACLVPDAAA
jgi:predicted RNA-binding protein